MITILAIAISIILAAAVTKIIKDKEIGKLGKEHKKQINKIKNMNNELLNKVDYQTLEIIERDKIINNHNIEMDNANKAIRKTMKKNVDLYKRLENFNLTGGPTKSNFIKMKKVN